MSGELDLDALEALADAATPGPWEVRGPFGVSYSIAEADLFRRPLAGGFYEKDARFSAAARAAVPQLIERVRAAEADRSVAAMQMSQAMREREAAQRELMDWQDETLELRGSNDSLRARLEAAQKERDAAELQNEWERRETNRIRDGIHVLADNAQWVRADALQALASRPAKDDQDNGQANTCRHQSASGVDTSTGPDKVWRCDHCGLRWTAGDRP